METVLDYTVHFFAAANGLTGDVQVEDQLRELQWEKHIDDLWLEFLSNMESPANKKSTYPR